MANKQIQTPEPIKWTPGLSMELCNSNGAIDSTSLGYQYTIQTTTQIRAQVLEQKFYEVPVADYVPISVGVGAFMESIKTNIQYDISGDFESGIQGVSSGPTQIPQVNVGTSPKTAVIHTWVFGYQYNVAEVQKALASNNWDVISGKMRALKKRYDLGIQKIAFLGLKGDVAATPGLLSNAEVTVDTATITKRLSDMTYSELGTFVSTIMETYFANSNYTVRPNRFVIPMADFLGLTTPFSAQFPNVSRLEYLTRAFKEATQDPSFEMSGLAYCDQVNNLGYWAAAGTNRYVLYRKDPDTVKMDLPVGFTLNPAATADNFNFNAVAYAQFGGAIIYRTPEVMYFDWHV